VRIRNPRTGAVLAEHVELATSFLQRLRGLIGRAPLKAGEALLIEPCASIHTFFMRFPVDVIFLGRDLRVIDAIHALPPWRVTPFHSGAVTVVELPAGAIAQSGTQEGDALEIHV
jgi:uncharacterized membrane protein (UPF0127 family)